MIKLSLNMNLSHAKQNWRQFWKTYYINVKILKKLKIAIHVLYDLF